MSDLPPDISEQGRCPASGGQETGSLPTLVGCSAAAAGNLTAREARPFELTCLDKFTACSTSAMVEMIPEKTKPPMIMPRMATMRSARVVAEMSPYPTVVMVVNAQYLARWRQLLHTSYA